MDTCIQNKRVYQHVAEQVRRGIRARRLQPGDEIGTEMGLVRETGASRKSVRTAVDMLVREGLVGRRPGKGLFVSGPTTPHRRIRLIVPGLDVGEHLSITRGLLDLARTHGIDVQVYDAHGDSRQHLDFIRNVSSGQAEGAVLVGLFVPEFSEVVYNLRASGYPVVVVGRWMHNGVPSVLADYNRGGYDVAKLLIDKGHRHIGIIGAFAGHMARDLSLGFRNAFSDAGLPFRRSLMTSVSLEPSAWDDEIEPALDKLFADAYQPTAIFCSSDAVAARVCRSLKARGIPVPDGVSVVGFGHDPYCEWLDPPLTTVRYPSEEIGKEALRVLLALIDNPQAKIENKVFPVELVPRSSVARI